MPVLYKAKQLFEYSSMLGGHPLLTSEMANHTPCRVAPIHIRVTDPDRWYYTHRGNC
jgi:hypothetical protein